MKLLFFLLILPFTAFAQINICDEDPKNQEYWHNWTSCQRITPTVIDKPASVYRDSITGKFFVIPATFKALPRKKCTCFDHCPKKLAKNIFDITIYPNPASDFLTISKPNNNLLNLQLVDINGKVIVDTNIETEKTLDISQIPNGLYFLVFCENGIHYRNKIIVHR